MKNAYLIYAIVFLITSTVAAQGPEFLVVKNENFWKVLPKNPKIELCATGFRFTEGPLWHAKGGYLLFSDIPANVIYQMYPDGRTVPYIQPSENSNGLTFDNQGNLLACEHGGRKLVRYKNGIKEILASEYAGKKLNSPNDVVVAKNGNIYFTDPPYGLKKGDADSTKQLAFNGVYLLKNNNLYLIDSTLYRPNGIALSPDEKTLYVAQSEKWLWKAYTLGQDGLPTTGRIFFEGKDITGNPDGIKVDVYGNVYATGNHGIMVFDPNGTWLGSIKFPENTTNLAWGDNDFKTLYVTCAKSVYKIKMKVKGYK